MIISKNIGSALLVVLLNSLAITSVLAQVPNLMFDHFNSDDGLSQSSVNAIIQDEKGFLWVGTQVGLNRFDGYSFKSYLASNKNPNSINDNFIHCLFIDSKGRLLVGTNNGGINIYRPDTDDFIAYSTHEDAVIKLHTNTILSIIEDQDGLIWATSSGGGMTVIDERKKIAYPQFPNSGEPDGVPSPYVKDITLTDNGKVWISSDGGLSLVTSFKEGKVSLKTYHPEEGAVGKLPNTYVKRILPHAHQKDFYWVLHDQGLSLFNAKKESFITYSHNPNNKYSIANNYAKALVYDNDGQLWVGTDGGLSIFDEKRDKFYNYTHGIADEFSLVNNYVKALFKDANGNIWVGTDGGISFYDKGKHIFKTYQNKSGNEKGLSSNNIKCLFKDDHGTWAGTDVGLNLLPKEGGAVIKITTKDGLPNNFVKAFIKDVNGVYWVGTDGGLVRMNYQKGKKPVFKVYTKNDQTAHPILNDAITYIFEDDESTLWVGTWGKGLFKFDKKTGDFFHFNPGNQMEHDEIQWITRDAYGQLWSGAKGGLLRIDQEQNSFERFMHDPANEETISNSQIFSYCITEDKEFWIGTNGGGINQYDYEKKLFRHFDQNPIFVSGSIRSIKEGVNGDLWISSAKGLIRFNKQTKKIKQYTVSEGIQGNEFNPVSGFKSKDGMLLFGGTNGLSTFYPGRISTNPNPPVVHLTGFYVDNEDYSLDNGTYYNGAIANVTHLDLEYGKTSLLFEFVGIDFRNPRKHEYAYKLEGFDRGWTYKDASARQATYTNLSPGTYNLWVKASNNDGVWSEKKMMLELVVVPPYWQELWFKLLVFVLVIASFYGFYKYRVRQIQLANQKLEKEVELRTKEVVAKNHALEEQHAEIVEKNAQLEQKNEEISAQRDQLEDQNRKIEESSKSIMDSIRYAKTIQQAILPHDEYFNKNFLDHFIFYQPRDIVSGDFYWMSEVPDKNMLFLSVIDCTGHGVPGAFMSMIGNTMLNQIIDQVQIYSPADILEELNKRVRKTLNQEQGMNDDGMDMSIIRIDQDDSGERLITFSGAKSFLWHYKNSDGVIDKVNGDRRSIGGMFVSGKEFTNQEIKANSGDVFYLATDGLADQSGTGRKRFGKARFEEILLEHQSGELKVLRENLISELESYMEAFPQRDDMTVLGFKLK